MHVSQIALFEICVLTRHGNYNKMILDKLKIDGIMSGFLNRVLL